MEGLSPYLPVQDLANEPLTFADLWIWTRDDPPAFVPFAPNAVQAMLLEDICAAYDVDPALPWLLKSARANVLKSRQQGMTTMWVALWYLMFYNLPYSQTLIVTHRADSTARIWQRVQLWERKLREMDGRKLPTLKYSSRRELMRADTGSSLYIATAGEDDTTRSGTITTLHKTETAFWPVPAGKVDVGALGTLPDWANIVEESTANGYGEHKERYDAEARDLEQVSRVYFFPFTDTPEYSQEPPADFQRTEKEERLFALRQLGPRTERIELTDAQIYWRRRRAAAFAAKRQGSLVGQEFPLTPTEAFLASATGAVYDVEYLTALDAEMADLEPETILGPGDRGFFGTLEMWEKPEQGVEYALGGDEAEGHNEDDEHDWTACDWFRCDTLEQVGVYYAQDDPERCASDIAGIAAYYNDAMIVIERTPVGSALIQALRPYSLNLYSHTFGPEDAPEHTKLGLPANERVKALRDSKMLAAIARAAKVWREEGVSPSMAARIADAPVFRSRRTINELIHYSHLPRRKRGGKGAHDDHNTSAGCAVYYLEEHVPRHPRERPPAPPRLLSGGMRRR